MIATATTEPVLVMASATVDPRFLMVGDVVRLVDVTDWLTGELFDAVEVEVTRKSFVVPRTHWLGTDSVAICGRTAEGREVMVRRDLGEHVALVPEVW